MFKFRYVNYIYEFYCKIYLSSHSPTFLISYLSLVSSLFACLIPWSCISVNSHLNFFNCFSISEIYDLIYACCSSHIHYPTTSFISSHTYNSENYALGRADDADCFAPTIFVYCLEVTFCKKLSVLDVSALKVSVFNFNSFTSFLSDSVNNF